MIEATLGKLVVTPDVITISAQGIGNTLCVRLVRPRIGDEYNRHAAPLPRGISGL